MKLTPKKMNTLYKEGKNYRSLRFDLLPNFNGKGLAYDLGCGRGESSYYLATKGYKTIGLDFSSEAIKLAKLFYSHPNLSFSTKDIRSKLKPCDLIILKLIVAFLKPLEVKKIITNLKPDGLLIIITPIINKKSTEKEKKISITDKTLKIMTTGLKCVSKKKDGILYYFTYIKSPLKSTSDKVILIRNKRLKT